MPFRRFFAGQFVSLVGDQISLIALPLVGVLVLHAGPAQMGYLTTAALIPNLLFSLHAGAWVDKRGRRRQVMLAADLGRAALLLSIPIAYGLDLLTIQQLYVVGFLSGTLSVFFYVAYNTLFVSLVPRDRYLEGQSLLNGSRALSFVGGPSAGGLLVQALSAPVALAGRRLLLPDLRVLAEQDLARGAADGARRAWPSARGRVLDPALARDPGLAAGHGDDQLLQLRLLGARDPVREPVPATSSPARSESSSRSPRSAP